MLSQTLIEMTNVTKTYKLGQTLVQALRGVNLTIKVGEFMVIMGPSGSGKTTLLNIMGCLDHSTGGHYFLDSQDLSGKPFNSLADVRNRKIGFIFQNFNLVPVLNVLENIEFPCLLRRHPENSRALRERVREMCQQVGLEKYVLHKPDELSGGQRQRVAIARALITQPRLVLADEPTANLDSKTSDQILELMMKLNQTQHVTFVFATHDSRVLDVSRRAVRISDGVIVESAST